MLNKQQAAEFLGVNVRTLFALYPVRKDRRTVQKGQKLLKVSPWTVRGYGERFSDAGFVFTRAGTRKRGEVAWEIGKRQKSPETLNH